MEQIPISQLNQDTAGALARVANGESLEVTNRGRVVARLVPPADDAYSRLVATGLLAPATLRGPIPMPEGEIDETGAASAALIQMREEERW
ncbi:hypothetical protein [Alloactinosynnema sp. L-07]|uniref:type II toxin-antitoxin system Phd/YefM family antitoxin n=1 Tax=Alloactinosynnema sp. L-07 TaxID=1653480 RepID=UPI00065EF7E2|nr:type II toxin-antitoxin system prevent-host-death family antitoxin [Alloactinosynnema sp. L-07]CRK60055.1 hypothetical protein [Alloactinosynnema sp. L-07]